MSRPVIAGSKFLTAFRHVAIQFKQFRRVIFFFFNFLAEQIFWFETAQVLNARTHETVASVQIDYQDKVGETFQQVPMKLLLTAQRFFHLPSLGYIHQRPLIANDFPSRIPDGARSIKEYAKTSVLAP